MNDWHSRTVEAQREIFRAHEAQVDAVGRMLHPGSEAADVQDAGRQVAEAQWKLWRAWAKLWGWIK
jgi:hypothetical protein